MFASFNHGHAAAPTAADDAKIVGRWHVSPPGMERIYEISAGRNVKIMGGTMKEKFGHLTPQNEGYYTVNLEGGAVQKIVFSAATDQLAIEYYDSKKNLELGLARWKSAGTRVPAK